MFCFFAFFHPTFLDCFFTPNILGKGLFWGVAPTFLVLPSAPLTRLTLLAFDEFAPYCGMAAGVLPIIYMRTAGKSASDPPNLDDFAVILVRDTGGVFVPVWTCFDPEDLSLSDTGDRSLVIHGLTRLGVSYRMGVRVGEAYPTPAHFGIRTES